MNDLEKVKQTSTEKELKKKDILFKEEYILLGVTLILAAILVAYNALTSPPLTSPVIAYTSSDESDLTSIDNSDLVQSETDTLSSDESKDDITENQSVTTEVPGISSKSKPPESSQVSSSNISPEAVSQKVRINYATAEELISLPGIGEVKANAIINYRNQNGPFQTIEQLTEVKGIGEATVSKLYDLIIID